MAPINIRTDKPMSPEMVSALERVKLDILALPLDHLHWVLTEHPTGELSSRLCCALNDIPWDQPKPRHIPKVTKSSK